ncbi:MAG: glycoside hydrolase family 65 protein [Candidatus Omnitrophica bacterium]|nr:glycoside hydrolase family 65 protein [Candidatus Omnitrophota bacterium]
MLRHKTVNPPRSVYPLEDWKIIETEYSPQWLAQNESIFSLGNGYLGMRGNFVEDSPTYLSGAFINGFYESYPIVYGEDAYGYARNGQTIVNVTDAKIIRLYVDDEPFELSRARILDYRRILDMKKGLLTRDVLWETPRGKQIQLSSVRMVSFEQKHLVAISYEVTVLNDAASVTISSEAVTEQKTRTGENDPRQAPVLGHRVLLAQARKVEKERIVLCYKTANSGLTLACAMDHQMDTNCYVKKKALADKDGGQVVYSVQAEAGIPIRLRKYVSYHTTATVSHREVAARAERTLDRAMDQGFDAILQEQEHSLQEFWNRSNVHVGSVDQAAQQCVNFNLFHILQATGKAEGTGVAAKGLTGEAYHGHYFWDTEVYVLPFWIYTNPRVARNLLLHRYQMLDKARVRAWQVNQKGALYPWRTINGEEASAYYASGTAQYHINADIMYAMKKYVDVTGDRDFLYEYGAEMLIETARLWVDLGFFSERRGGKFCVHGVTGPDEYNTVVDNNTFTNLMARENLRYAISALAELQEVKPGLYEKLISKTMLDHTEIANWEKAAGNMYIPYDDNLGIHPQDDNFLDKKPWDWDTPLEKYPLLLYHHPLVIYRHQVIKQADIVLAMFLLGNEFSWEQKKRNFDFYDPLTTGDSSLSVCIQSIMAFELGYRRQALDYFRYALLMDLSDVGGNVRDGCHIASMGGTWMALVYGFAGLRDYNGRIRFDPENPGGEEAGIKFPLRVRGQDLIVDIQKDQASYCLQKGAGLTIEHQGEVLDLIEGVPVCREIRPRGTSESVF